MFLLFPLLCFIFSSVGCCCFLHSYNHSITIQTKTLFLTPNPFSIRSSSLLNPSSKNLYSKWKELVIRADNQDTCPETAHKEPVPQADQEESVTTGKRVSAKEVWLADSPIKTTEPKDKRV